MGCGKEVLSGLFAMYSFYTEVDICSFVDLANTRKKYVNFCDFIFWK